MMKSTKSLMLLSLIVFLLLTFSIQAGEEEESCEEDDTAPTADGMTWLYNANSAFLEDRIILYPAGVVPSPPYDPVFWIIGARNPHDFDAQDDCCDADFHNSKEWEINNPSIGASLMHPISHITSPYFSYTDNFEVVPFSDLPGSAALTCTIWNYDSGNNNYGPCPYNEGEGETKSTTIKFIDLEVADLLPANDVQLQVLPDSTWPVPYWLHNSQYYKYDWKWGWGWTKHVYTNQPMLLYTDIINVDPNFCGENFMVSAMGDRGDSQNHEIEMLEEFSQVGVEKIQIYAESSWHDVQGTNIVLLKGTRYQFKAIKKPSNLSWPSGFPMWYGIACGVGETIWANFDSDGSYYLKAKCGQSEKIVDINVVTPEVDTIDFYGNGTTSKIQSVVNVEGVPEWRKSPYRNNPACYLKNSYALLKSTYTASLNLSFLTPVIVDADDGINPEPKFYGEVQDQWKSWPTDECYISSSEPLDNKIYHYMSDFWTRWRYKPLMEGGNWNNMINNEIHHIIYTTYDTHKCDISNFKQEYLQEAVYYSPHNLNPTEEQVASQYNDDITRFQSVDDGCICQESFDEVWNADKDGSDEDGMCCCRALGLIYFLQVIGIGGYNQVFINEYSEPNASRDWADSYCSTCQKDVERKFWCGFWNNWEGVARKGGDGTQCYAPANGNDAFIDEGTYNQIRDDISGNPSLGFYWQYGPLKTDICPHLQPPSN